MQRLADKVTVIAGAGCGHGMGRGFPEIFARESSHLVLNHYRQDPDKMRAFIGQLESRGVRVIALEGDITEERVARELIEAAVGEFGRVDVLLNTQGITGESPIQDITLEQWNRMQAVHLTSMFLTCKYAVPVMIRQRFGRIINIASQVGQKGTNDLCHYASAKAGIIGFTKSLAREVGKHGVTANCIAPGPIKTQMMAQSSEEWMRNKLSELVIPRFGELEEVLPTAIFLASEPDGNLYTGQTLGPNCGDVML